MSCSLYRWTEECEGQPCPGDCDLCNKNSDEGNEFGNNIDEISKTDNRTWWTPVSDTRGNN